MSCPAAISREERQPVAIVCSGNWLIDHDRIGPLVLEQIRGRYGADVEVIDCGSAGLALLDCIRKQELMVVVDACVLGGKPGEVRRIEPDLDVGASGSTSVHQIGPMETLAIASRLYPEELPLRIVMILVETEGIDGAFLDAAAADAVSAVDLEIEVWQEQRSAACGPSVLTTKRRSDTPD